MINYSQISNVCKHFKFSREECKAMVKSIGFQKCKSRKKVKSKLHNCVSILKGSYDAISSFPFSLECYKLIVYR